MTSRPDPDLAAQPPRRGRWALANVIVALAAGAVVAGSLQGRVRDVGTVAPLATAAAADVPALVPLPVSSSRDGSITRSIGLRFPQAVPPGLEEIELRVDTYGATPALSAGTITIAETCTFEADAATLRTGGSVLFRRTTPCSLPAQPVPATLSLQFRERDVQDARCALVAIPPGAAAPVLGVEFNGRAYGLVGRHTTLKSETTMTRAGLLAFMWHRGPSFVWAAFAACVFLLALAGASLTSSRTGLLAGGLGASAAALAIAYAVLVPPLQAPDEPNHLLGYANAIGDSSLPARTEAWARALHFERVTFFRDQTFRPSDRSQPHAAPWGAHVTPVDETSRGALNVRYWRALAPWLGAEPWTTLVRLRVANAIVFGAAVALAGWLLARGREQRSAHLIVLGLLVVPTLPFFAMHMSNYAPLASAYVLLAVAAGAIVHGRTDAPGVALMLGLGMSSGLGTSLSALPMVAVLGAALAAVTLGRAGDSRRPRYLFWGMFVLGALAIGVTPSGADPLSKAGIYRGPAFLLLSGWGWIAIALGAAGVAFDYAAGMVKRRPHPAADAAIARVLQLLAVAIAAGALASLAWDFPLLQPMETRDRWPTPWGYAGEVLRAAAGLGRLSHPDWYLSSTFWAGFGWLDTYPGDWLTNLLTGATVAALVGLLLVTARTRDSRKAVRLLLVGCGGIAALAVYAAGASVQRTNLHGRYVFGLYLCGVAVCWSVLAVASASRDDRRQLVTSGLFAVILAIHAVCLTVVLRRYF